MAAVVLVGGCAYIQVNVKAPKSEPAPTVGYIDVDANFGYKGNAGSARSTNEAGGTTLQPPELP